MQLSILALLAVAYAAAASPRRILDRQTCFHGKQVGEFCNYNIPGDVDHICCPGLQCQLYLIDPFNSTNIIGVRPSASALFSLTGVLDLRRYLRLKS